MTVACHVVEPDPRCAARRCRVWFVGAIAFGPCGASGGGTPAARHGLAASAHTRCPAHRTGVLGESISRPDLRPTNARGGRASRHERDRHLAALALIWPA